MNFRHHTHSITINEESIEDDEKKKEKILSTIDYEEKTIKDSNYNFTQIKNAMYKENNIFHLSQYLLLQ